MVKLFRILSKRRDLNRLITSFDDVFMKIEAHINIPEHLSIKSLDNRVQKCLLVSWLGGALLCCTYSLDPITDSITSGSFPNIPLKYNNEHDIIEEGLPLKCWWPFDVTTYPTYQLTYAYQHRVDVMLLGETHLRSAMRFSLAELICHRSDRAVDVEKGGTAVLVRRGLDHHVISLPPLQHMEATAIQLVTSTGPSLAELDSDHNPVLVNLGRAVSFIDPPEKPDLKRTDWDRFTNVLRERLGPTPTFRTAAEIDRGAEFITSAIKGSLEASTPRHRPKRAPQASLPDSILRHVREKNRLRKAWQISRDPVDKANWSRKVHAVREMVREYRNSVWEDKIESLCVQDRSLWQMTRNLMRVPAPRPPIVSRNGVANSDQEKADALAEHLEAQFVPTDNPSDPVHVAHVAQVISAVSSILDYACPTWGHLTDRYIRRMQAFQSMCLRVIVDAPWSVGPSPYLTTTTHVAGTNTLPPNRNSRCQDFFIFKSDFLLSNRDYRCQDILTDIFPTLPTSPGPAHFANSLLELSMRKDLRFPGDTGGIAEREVVAASGCRKVPILRPGPHERNRSFLKVGYPVIVIPKALLLSSENSLYLASSVPLIPLSVRGCMERCGETTSRHGRSHWQFQEKLSWVAEIKTEQWLMVDLSWMGQLTAGDAVPQTMWGPDISRKIVLDRADDNAGRTTKVIPSISIFPRRQEQRGFGFSLRDWNIRFLRDEVFGKALNAFLKYFFSTVASWSFLKAPVGLAFVASTLVLPQGTSGTRLYGLTCFTTHSDLRRSRGESEWLNNGRT
uniref:Uncharacterized protein n=1 Tax=Timema cristinae TaxID=61476 RepID=A0A7R9D144_TIMCR|nr:unnamed protein product [Timema cristinae]